MIGGEEEAHDLLLLLVPEINKAKIIIKYRQFMFIIFTRHNRTFFTY